MVCAPESRSTRTDPSRSLTTGLPVEEVSDRVPQPGEPVPPRGRGTLSGVLGEGASRRCIGGRVGNQEGDPARVFEGAVVAGGCFYLIWGSAHLNLRVAAG